MLVCHCQVLKLVFKIFLQILAVLLHIYTCGLLAQYNHVCNICFFFFNNFIIFGYHGNICFLLFRILRAPETRHCGCGEMKCRFQFIRQICSIPYQSVHLDEGTTINNLGGGAGEFFEINLFFPVFLFLFDCFFR